MGYGPSASRRGQTDGAIDSVARTVREGARMSRVQTDWRRTLSAQGRYNPGGARIEVRVRWQWPGNDGAWHLKAALWVREPPGAWLGPQRREWEWDAGYAYVGLDTGTPCDLWLWVRTVQQDPGCARSWYGSWPLPTSPLGLKRQPFHWHPPGWSPP
jgi:hypothetical protein